MKSETSSSVEDNSLVKVPSEIEECRKRCKLIGPDFLQCGAFCGKWMTD